MTTLETDRLILRPYTSDDAETLADLIGNWNVAKTLASVPHPYSLEDAEGFISRQLDKTGGARDPIFAIQIKVGPTHAVGSIGIHPEREDADGEAEIGFWLGEPYWGQGFMSETALAVVAHAFEGLGYKRLWAGHFVDNLASRGVLQNCGFAETGRRMIASIPNGRDMESCVMELPRERWMER